MDLTGYGNLVIIYHDESHSTLYAHLSLISVKPGEHVSKGQKIGESGNTGYSTGPHLHFEARTRWNDFRSHFDPMELPMMTVDDSISSAKEPEDSSLTIPEAGIVMIPAPLGAYGHNDSFTWKFAFPRGFELPFTGETREFNGLTFCECKMWIAAHDGDTQILENRGN